MNDLEYKVENHSILSLSSNDDHGKMAKKKQIKTGELTHIVRMTRDNYCNAMIDLFSGIFQANMPLTGHFWMSVLVLMFSSNAGFATCDKPVIDSLSTLSGTVNTSVSILGSNFRSTASENTVWFGGVKATITSASANMLTVSVPPGAGNPVSVYTPCGMTQYALYFTVTTDNQISLIASDFTGPNTSYGFAIKNGNYAGFELHTFNNLSYSDLDGDGKLDAMFGRLGVYTQRNTTVNPGVIKSGKVVGNEVIGASFETRYYNGTGQNLVNEVPTHQSYNAREGDITFGDIDGDGKHDIVSCVYRPANIDRVMVHKNTSTSGSISFTSTQLSTGGKWARWVRLADFDNDGKPDILVSLSAGGGCIFRNQSTSESISFGAMHLLGLLDAEVFLQTADLDKDGRIDIITRPWGGAIKVYRNTSTGAGVFSFAAAQTLTIDSGGTWCVSIGDLDNDNKLDLVAAASSGKISILRNNSSKGVIAFDAYQSFSTGIPAGAGYTSLGDLNGDGLLDLAIVPNGDYWCYAAKNTSSKGSISFSTPFNINSIVNLPQYTAGVSIGDFDGDGDYDIATISQYTNYINYYSNGTITLASWNGAVNTDWHNAGNWDDGVVPGSASNVFIPNVTNKPVIGSNALCRNISVQSSSSLTIQSGKTLNINGNFILEDNSSFSNSGTLQFSGADCHLTDNRSSKTNLGNITVTD